MAKALKMPSSVWTKVFRVIVQQLENDAVIKRVVGTENLRSWKGVQADKAPFVPSSSAPVVRLTPQPRSVDWYSPDASKGTLVVIVEEGVQSLCIDDTTDLYDVIVTALQPDSPVLGTSLTFAQALVSAGAETGEIVFGEPAYDPRPDADAEGQFFATGQFALEVIRPVYR
jgi:hypothetical protein